MNIGYLLFAFIYDYGLREKWEGSVSEEVGREKEKTKWGRESTESNESIPCGTSINRKCLELVF